MIRFGINATELDATASTIGRVLGVAFHPHESDSRGGPYCRAEVRDGLITIQRNRDLYDDEPLEPDWPLDKLLLLVDGETDASWRHLIELLNELDNPHVVELR